MGVDSEGLPTTILEAMAAGRVVVASDVGGASEAVRDGQDGLIVPAGDSMALADALESLIRDGAFGARMAQNARRRVAERFDLPVMMQEIHRTYDRLLQTEKIS